MRLGILTSHPIQYQAPWFRALAKQVDLEVFFCHRQTAAEQGTAGFGVAFDWDVDLLSGYQHRFLKNVSRNPGVNHFAGCDTPEITEIIKKTESRKQTTETEGQNFNFQLSTFNFSPFDAFLVTGWYLKSYLQAVRACRAAGVPVLVRGDSHLRTPRSLLKRFAMEMRQRWLLRKFDGFLSVGQRHREYLEHYGVPSQKIFFAPHFVDNEWFAARAAAIRGFPLRLDRGESDATLAHGMGEGLGMRASGEVSNPQSEVGGPSSVVSGPLSVVSGPVVCSPRSVVRTQWGIPDDAFCVLFCGKFIPIKRPLDLVQAARLLMHSASQISASQHLSVSDFPSRSAVGTPHSTGSISAFSFQLSTLPVKLHLLFVGSGELGPQLRESCHVVFDAEKSSLSASDGERAGERCGASPSGASLSASDGERAGERCGASPSDASLSASDGERAGERCGASPSGASLSASDGERAGERCSPSSISHPPPSTSARPRATFAGFKNQTELPACYAAADVLVLPSESETWGLAVNEAMACGLPAIVSDAVGCAPDLIEDGRTGLTFPVGETGPLAEALLKLAAMKNRGHDFGPALKAKMQTYNLTTAVEGTLRAVRELGKHKKLN